MSIYAIGDLHLSFGVDKPMNIFGNSWEGFEEKIKQNWIEKITGEDIVLIPGDFSWAIHIEEAKKDFEYINNLPGRKIILKGNHDYWWETLKSMREFIMQNGFDNIDFLINNAYVYEKKVIVGTRGWSFLDSENSEKMHNRELIRLENSIKYGQKLAEEMKLENYDIVAMMHYPPISKQMLQQNEKSKYLELMNKYNIKKCIYGHLHGKAHQESVEGIVDRIDLKLVSSDYLEFNPVKIK